MQAEKKLRVAILGCGAIAQRRHAPEYASNPRAEIAGFFDASRERAQELSARYGGVVYATVEEALESESADAVSVCTPNTTHADMSVRALNRGKHVLCEKPMALSLAETRAMLEAQRKSGKLLMPGHNQRFMRAHLKAKELLDQGAIGKTLFVQCNFKHSGPENWSVDSSRGTWFFRKDQAFFGVLGDLGAHKLDLIRFLTGDEISRVRASLMTLDKKYADGSPIDLDDNAICEFVMTSGVPGIMHFSWTNYGQSDNSAVIYGDNGVMKIFGDYADDIVLEMRDRTIVKYHVGETDSNQQQQKSGVIDEFVDAALSNRQPIVTGVDGHNTMAVITASEESAAKGTWTDVIY